MYIESKMSGHWTDEQLIDHLYGLAPESGGEIAHLAQCCECCARMAAMQANREQLELQPGWDGVDPERLLAQRRAIYARLAEPVPWWHYPSLWRWASASTAALMLGGGLFIFQGDLPRHSFSPNDVKVSDAQLAQEVSSLSQDSEAQSTAPLKGLFE